MKLDQSVCLKEISDELENGSCWIKILFRMVASMKPQTSLKISQVGSKPVHQVKS